MEEDSLQSPDKKFRWEEGVQELLNSQTGKPIDILPPNKLTKNLFPTLNEIIFTGKYAWG